MPHWDCETSRPTYVQVARRLACSPTSVTLLDLAPATLVIGTPGHELGYVSTGQFLDAWYADESGAATHASGAVLSLLDPDRPAHSDARLLLRLPRIRGTGVEYQVAVVVGQLPESGGACVLCINPRAPLLAM